MLFELRSIVKRHVPAGEVDELRAHLAVSDV
jgi:hypothetical protein